MPNLRLPQTTDLSRTALSCILALTLAVAAAWAPSLHASDSALEGIRNAARGSGGSGGGGHSNSDSGGDHKSHGGGGGRGGGGGGGGHHDDDDDDDYVNPLAELSGEALLWAFASPYWVPVVASDDDYSNWTRFCNYPYADDAPGLLAIQGVSRPGLYEHAKPWSVQFAVDNSQDFALDLNTTRVTIRIDTAVRWGLESSWAYLNQTLPGGATDQLGLSNVRMEFRFAQTETFAMHSGLGMNFLLDGMNSHNGFDISYGFDLWPVDPLVISAEMDGGNVGAAGLFHVRGQIGVVSHHFEIYAGYDYLQIESINIRGPMAGVRIYF